MQFPWLETYQACLTTGVYFVTPPVGRLVVTGNDRVAFLQNFCTNDIQKLSPGESCEAFFTSVQGHVLAHAVVGLESERIVLHLLGSDPGPLVSHLDRYLIREAVTLQTEQKPTCWIVGGSPFPGACRTDLLGIPASFVALDDSVEGALCEARFQPGGDALWNTLRVEAGLPFPGVDYGERALPQELSRDAQTICFTKGCYLGQETIARIDALGHVNKQLVQVKFKGDQVPELGLELWAGEKQVGAITSATWSPALRAPVGLAMVRRGCNEPGTQLRVDGGEAEVVSPPEIGLPHGPG